MIPILIICLCQNYIVGIRNDLPYEFGVPSPAAYTVTGSGGSDTHIYHYAEPRALTNRERARLQTFPNTYEIMGTKESVRKQIGMAVPSKGIRIIFEAILKTFAGIDYEKAPFIDRPEQHEFF